MDQLPIKKKIAEARWKKFCSDEHRKWCPCGDWTAHVKKCPTTREIGVGDATIDGDSDAAFAEAMLDAAITEGGRYGDTTKKDTFTIDIPEQELQQLTQDIEERLLCMGGCLCLYAPMRTSLRDSQSQKNSDSGEGPSGQSTQEDGQLDTFL